MDENKKTAPVAAPASAASSTNNSNDTLMGVLAYLGILCLVPLLAAKDSDFAQYHAKQGLTLFVCEVVVWVAFWFLAFVFWPLYLLSWVLWVGFVILTILGIVNVVNHKKEPLPVIGGFHIIK